MKHLGTIINSISIALLSYAIYELVRAQTITTESVNNHNKSLASVANALESHNEAISLLNKRTVGSTKIG